MLVRLGVVASCLLSACSTVPDRIPWRTDLESARREAGAAGLVVVDFVAGGHSVLTTLDRKARARLVRQAAVRLDVNERSTLFRDTFEIEPQPALAIAEGHGYWLALHTGPVDSAALCALLERASILAPTIQRLHDELLALPLRGPRARQRALNYELAEAYLASGNPYEAHRRFALVTLLAAGAPRDALVLRACERLARLEVDRGHTREAREWLGELRQRDPERFVAEVQLTEAVIARAEARPEDACAVLDGLRQARHPEPDRVLFELGRARHDAGRDVAARRAFEALVSRYPNSEFALAARSALRHLDDPQQHDGHRHPTHPHRHDR